MDILFHCLTFKYLGLLFDANGGADVGAKQQSKYCLVKVEGNGVQDGYKQAMVYGTECWAVKKKEERKLHTIGMRMLRLARGKTGLDHVRNVDIWKEAHMGKAHEIGIMQ